MIPKQIQELIERGAIFYANHSGGKDSQAMFDFLYRHVPHHQIRVVHADLPEVEWDGVLDHIKATTRGHRVYVCRARRTLIQMITERGMFPSPTKRQCTSDLKRGPIERTIRNIIKDDKLPGIVVNCMGMRAEESTNRAKLETLKYMPKKSVQRRVSKTGKVLHEGREWWDWLPIHDWKVEKVFDTIAAAGQEPHWAYKAGMTRLSCCFCIMASKQDLTTAAGLNPKLYKQYVELERSTGQVMMMPSKSKGRQTLEEITGVYIDDRISPT